MDARRAVHQRVVDLLESRDLAVRQARDQRDFPQGPRAVEQPRMQPRGKLEHLAVTPGLGQCRGADMIVHVDVAVGDEADRAVLAEGRSEEHTSELQSLMRISYAVFCLKKKKQ